MRSDQKRNRQIRRLSQAQDRDGHSLDKNGGEGAVPLGAHTEMVQKSRLQREDSRQRKHNNTTCQTCSMQAMLQILVTELGLGVIRATFQQDMELSAN